MASRNAPQATLPPFARTLITLREKAGLSSYALAKAAGLNLSFLRRLELGERRPSWDAVQKLAAALGIPTDAFRTATEGDE